MPQLPMAASWWAGAGRGGSGGADLDATACQTMPAALDQTMRAALDQRRNEEVVQSDYDFDTGDVVLGFGRERGRVQFDRAQHGDWASR